MEPKKHLVPRADIQHTLHAHFQAAKAPEKTKEKHVRKHVVAFLHVKKLKTTSAKRMFGSFGNSTCKLLCMTTHDVVENGATKVVGQLHYVNFQANYTIDCRKTWALDDLESLEDCSEDVVSYPRGSFRLKFRDNKDANEPFHWVAHASESPTAMKEFVWALSALYVDTQHVVAESTFSLQELAELATANDLAGKYGLDVDLLAFQQTPQHTERRRSWDVLEAPASPAKDTTVTKSIEVADAVALLATVDWDTASVESVEAAWHDRLRLLDDANMEFLLTFQGTSNGDEKKAMDPLLAAIDGVLREVKMAEKWTEDADTTLGNTSANMAQFESLNSQMEVHFKNSVALEGALRTLIEAVDVPRELLGPLLKPVGIFPTQNSPEADPSVLATIVAAVQRVDAAIKSVDAYPAKHMAAFQARRDEFVAIGSNFSEKLAGGLDLFLQQRVKACLQEKAQNRRQSVSSANDMPRKTLHVFGRDREASALPPKDSRVRSPSTASADDADWSFCNDTLHRELSKYKELCSSVSVLSGRATTHLRDIYAKHVAQIYGPHVQTVFRALKEKLPKAKAATSLPGKSSSWSLTLSFSHAPEVASTITASQLLKQGLDHVLPLCASEQAFVQGMFFHSDGPGIAGQRKAKCEPPELTSMMEAVFEKMLKRLIDFAEAGVHSNMMEALSMIVTAQVAASDVKSDFVTNTLLYLQLHLKRVFSKYIEEQEAWLEHIHPDTRLVGVLGPVQKMMTLIGRLEGAGDGAHDEAILAPIYDRLVTGLFAWLEKAATTKPKYSHLVRLENYHFMHDKLTALSLHGGHSDVVLKYTQLVYDEYNKNLAAYAAWLWRCECDQYIAIFESIARLLSSVPVGEVQFHVSKHDVRKTLEATNQTLEKAIKHIGDRLKKHLSHSPSMVTVVSQSLQTVVLEQHATFGAMAKDCYDMELVPSMARLTSLLAKLP
ncbi:hypothetical protein SDRG_11036 [Saprolegnia diclina VS20]|uniref:Exocyst complex component Sec3 C-terminal domain-containing protein n=1 Tax=Saprolegnia diclina (strain VS20) TaxID=1156394 RepID=T0RNA4_SAPDV|nr:hypothetical protein SDRG_11036 [Saprolegnia diclina VS20]EQC31437.1 hypothetical protein SDRG_11036 [Saprolegnia diclina VS20]|eukprot:XP_008615278.1 hypothetical protein SDRG_11036 [Saprolegnia diclina VS20]